MIMEESKMVQRIFLLLLLSHFCVGKKQHYIVVLDSNNAAAMTEEYGDAARWYSATLSTVSGTASLVYSYDQVLKGFSAKMTATEAEELEKHPEVLSVIPDQAYQLHTTHTPEFLEMDKVLSLFSLQTGGHNYNAAALSDVVIGVLDTGVTPESKSFADTGMPAIPSWWRGSCQIGANFTKSNCNNKLIGANFFLKGYKANVKSLPKEQSISPRDDDGHGTHTASTAAGSPVPGASLFGYANGTASGMAPQARVAVYKVCWLLPDACFASDILAGMDQAIQDNVSILSLSLGATGALPYVSDPIAVGAFSAMAKGIFVSCSAGNSGPRPFTVSNVAPWITTVGAGTVDRDFPADVQLVSNGATTTTYRAVSLYDSTNPLPQSVTGPLIYAGDAAASNNKTTDDDARLCKIGSLNPEKVKGKIVVCDRGVNPRAEKGFAVKEAGGMGMVLANDEASGEELVADAHLLPAAAVGYNDGVKIKEYLRNNNTKGAKATILFRKMKLNVQPSPVVAAFSSRGPNLVAPEILKPDLIAPGVNILAAWSDSVGPTGLRVDTRRVRFNIISGTSMSCPHVSGIAAVLKAAHRDWSPAAIRSALMTTAYSTYQHGTGLLDAATGNPSTPFNHGSGHVNPLSAIDPGLVYDINQTEYANSLCATGYDSKTVQAITRGSYTCNPKQKYVGDLNYPSFSVMFNGSSPAGEKQQTRTLTSVRPGLEKYNAIVTMQKGSTVNVAVNPNALTFSQINDKKTYTVTFTSSSKKTVPAGTMESIFGRIEWVSTSKDGKTTRVASPLVVSWA